MSEYVLMHYHEWVSGDPLIEYFTTTHIGTTRELSEAHVFTDLLLAQKLAQLISSPPGEAIRWAKVWSVIELAAVPAELEQLKDTHDVHVAKEVEREQAEKDFEEKWGVPSSYLFGQL